MPRSRHIIQIALVVLAVTTAACAAKGPTPPPVPVFHPGPTPAMSVGPEHKYAFALIAKFASDPLVLHSVQTTKATAELDAESAKLNTTVTVDLSDRDHHLHMVSKTPAGKTVKSDLVVVGKAVYTRLGSGRWTKGSRADYERSHTDINRAYQVVRNPTDLRYVGRETIDKRKLHHLTAVRDLPFMTVTGMPGTYTRLDIWVEEDGTPVLLKGTITTVVDYGIEITGKTEMRFSKFGGSIKIVAPKN